MSDKNLYPESFDVTRVMRAELNRHGSALLWFTGLSGSGKSTICRALEKALYLRNTRTYILDGDNIRNGLNSDLDFSSEDRCENIRRIGEVGKLFVDAGVLTMAAFISPFRSDRERIRALMSNDSFIEIYIKCSLCCCEERDTKGLYRRVRNGEIKNFTGISSPYEPPLNPEIVLDTEQSNPEECVNIIINYLLQKEIINGSTGTA